MHFDVEFLIFSERNERELKRAKNAMGKFQYPQFDR